MKKKFAKSGYEIITCKGCKIKYVYAGESASCSCGWNQRNDLCSPCSRKAWSDHEEFHQSVELVD